MSTADYVAKYGRRRALQATVEKYWLDEAYRELVTGALQANNPGPPGQLDSSLKKHTTLINRLKSALLVGPADAIIKEIDGLVLTKYLEEIAAAVIEGAGRGRGDSEVAVDVRGCLHFEQLSDTPDHRAPPQAVDARFPPAAASGPVGDTRSPTPTR
jgi:regulator of nonsense transcripts 2